MSSRTFGQSVKRLEDPDLLRGKGRFVDDISLPGMLEAAFVRSPHAHASIRSIDKTAALALPGVHAVLTMADLRPFLKAERLAVALPSPSFIQYLDRPVLAIDEVVHVGEAVALIIAEDRYIAEDAATVLEFDYETLPAASDCREALGAAAPRVHRRSAHNLLARFDTGYGDVAQAFAKAAHVFGESLWQHRGGSHSIECRGAVAMHDAAQDRLTLWSSTQTPHTAMRMLTSMLGLDENQVRVITPDVGGGFGPKLVFYPEDVAIAIGAMLLGRPLKWIEDRREHFVATTQERDQYWELEIAVDADARILGVRGEIIHDHGAYTARGLNIPQQSATAVALQYVIPAYAMNVKVALSNKVPVTPVRGAGTPQGTFAIERLLDRVAIELKLDRAEVRRRNIISTDKMPYAIPMKTRGGIPIVLDSGDYLKCQQQVLARIGWDDFPARQAAALADGRHIGIGLANFVEATGRGPFEAVTVKVGPSGKIHIYSGAAAMGQGTKTMLAQIVAEQLGGDMANMTVTTGDTAAISIGIGGFNSRLAVMAGSSAHVAALKVREKALRIASHLLEASEHDLEIEGSDIFIKGVREKSVRLADVALSVAGIPGYPLPPGVTPGLEATEHVVIDEMTYANGCAASEVEVDIETGAVKILRFVVSHDCGRVINPMLVQGQLLGGVAHGISNALFEWMGFDENAQPVTTNLGDYLLITATEMPAIEVLHLESPTPLNPLGVKGVGEAGVMPAAAALVSAIENALTPFGVHLTQTPIFPARILELIEQSGQPQAV